MCGDFLGADLDTSLVWERGKGKEGIFAPSRRVCWGWWFAFHESMRCRAYLTFADARSFSLNTDAFEKQAILSLLSIEGTATAFWGCRSRRPRVARALIPS